MADRSGLKCPQCESLLIVIRYPSGCQLNHDQWADQLAGDCKCLNCPDNGRGKSGEAYFWFEEVGSPPREYGE